MQEGPITEIMLFLSKGVAAPTFSYFYVRSLQTVLLLVPAPPLERKSLQNFIIPSLMVVELWEEATQKSLCLIILKNMRFYDRVSKCLCHKMCFIYLLNFCLKTFCTSVIFPKLEMSVERSSGSKWILLQGEVFNLLAPEFYIYKSPTWCNSLSVYYPDFCLQLNMFRAFSRQIIRSSMTAVAASDFTFVLWWQSCCVHGRAGRPYDDARTYKP